MIYTPEEKSKMDALVAAFRPYIDQMAEYELLYSERAGYILLDAGECSDHMYFPIEDFADMMRKFTNDFLLEEEERVGHYLKLDYDHVRSLLSPFLDTLDEYRNEAYQIMEQAFASRRALCERTRQQYLQDIQRLEETLAALRAAV